MPGKLEKLTKILFLDCDGVLNNAGSFRDEHGEYHRTPYVLEPELIARVQRIVAETGCKIVLSSSWRLKSEGREAVKKHFKLVDITPRREGMRGLEIRAWTDRYMTLLPYAILDDNSDFFAYQPLFKTKFDTGITDEIVNKVIVHLNGDKHGTKQRVPSDGAVGRVEKGTGPTAPTVGSTA